MTEVKGSAEAVENIMLSLKSLSMIVWWCVGNGLWRNIYGGSH